MCRNCWKLYIVTTACRRYFMGNQEPRMHSILLT
jgi:hypothetical protein